MNAAFTEGFAGEIVKLAGTKQAGLVSGALKAVGGLAARHPWATIFGVAPAIMGAGKAFAQRMGGAAGEEASVLGTKAFRPSPAFYTNFHELMPHELQPWEKFRLHRNFPKWRATEGATP